jgi:hypothetical protein
MKGGEKQSALPALLIFIVFVVLFLISPKIAYITLQGFWIGGAATAFVLICEEIKHG